MLGVNWRACLLHCSKVSSTRVLGLEVLRFEWFPGHTHEEQFVQWGCRNRLVALVRFSIYVIIVGIALDSVVYKDATLLPLLSLLELLVHWCCVEQMW